MGFPTCLPLFLPYFLPAVHGERKVPYSFPLSFCLDAKGPKNQDAFKAIASHRYLPDLLAFSAGGIDLAWHFPG